LKENAALLIINDNEIVEDQELFLADQEYAHLCGYDYSILFWRDSENLSHEIFLNSECEIFSYKPEDAQKRLDYYKRKLETKPTHFIYNLELSILTEPEVVKSVFEDSGLNLFFLDGLSNRLPSIYFSYRHNTFVGKRARDKKWAAAEIENEVKTKAKLDTMIAKVKRVSNVLQQSDITFHSYGQAREFMIHNGSVELKFKLGTDLQDVKDILLKEGAKIGETKIPKNYYIQLVDTSANIDYIKHKMLKYKIVNDVIEYSE
jgi:hypothetical protein